MAIRHDRVLVSVWGLIIALLYIEGLCFPIFPQHKTEFRAAFYTMGDNNIPEIPKSKGGMGHQISLSARFQYPLLTHRWTLQLRSNNFLYYSQTRKNRTMNQLHTAYLWRISEGFFLQPQFNGEVKQYLDDPRNYRLLAVGFSAILQTPAFWQWTLNAVRSKKYFPSYPQFNNLSDILSFSIRIPVYKNFHFTGSAFAGNHRYSKSAINYQYHIMPYPQRDNTFGTGWGIEFSSSQWFMMMQYQYQAIFSNSYGSSFSYHKLDALLIRKISQLFFIKLYGSTQKRYYPDKIITPDVSANLIGSDFQSLIAEIGRKTGKDYELKFRFHWFRNQVLFTDYFYNRTVVAIGIEKDF